MEEEYGALLANQTQDLVPPPPHANIVSGKWLYRHKLNADGSLVGTRLVGSYVVSLSSTVLIMMKHSVQ
jgi:hypothetical protein